MAESDNNNDVLELMIKGVSNTEIKQNGNKCSQKFKKKNVKVAEEWIAAYAKLPEPKLNFATFCSLAIKEKLEIEGAL